MIWPQIWSINRTIIIGYLVGSVPSYKPPHCGYVPVKSGQKHGVPRNPPWHRNNNNRAFCPHPHRPASHPEPRSAARRSAPAVILHTYKYCTANRRLSVCSAPAGSTGRPARTSPSDPPGAAFPPAAG